MLNVNFKYYLAPVFIAVFFLSTQKTTASNIAEKKVEIKTFKNHSRSLICQQGEAHYVNCKTTYYKDLIATPLSSCFLVTFLNEYRGNLNEIVCANMSPTMDLDSIRDTLKKMRGDKKYTKVTICAVENEEKFRKWIERNEIFENSTLQGDAYQDQKTALRTIKKHIQENLDYSDVKIQFILCNLETNTPASNKTSLEGEKLERRNDIIKKTVGISTETGEWFTCDYAGYFWDNYSNYLGSDSLTVPQAAELIQFIGMASFGLEVFNLMFYPPKDLIKTALEGNPLFVVPNLQKKVKDFYDKKAMESTSSFERKKNQNFWKQLLNVAQTPSGSLLEFIGITRNTQT